MDDLGVDPVPAGSLKGSGVLERGAGVLRPTAGGYAGGGRRSAALFGGMGDGRR